MGANECREFALGRTVVSIGSICLPENTLRNAADAMSRAPFGHCATYALNMSSPPLSQPDQEQFVAQFAKANRRLYGFLYTLLASWDDVEEVFQRASVVMWQKYATYQPGTDFVRWACQIAYFEAMNYRRERSRTPLQFGDGLLEKLSDESQAQADRFEPRSRALEHCMQRLAEDDRRLVESRYSLDQPARALAESASLPVNTVFKKLQRLRRQLLDCIRRQLTADES